MRSSIVSPVVRSLVFQSTFVLSSKRCLHRASTSLMNHPVFKRLNKPPSAVSSRSFPPPEGLSSHDAPTVFDAKVWASLQPPPPSALATFAARLSLPVTTATTNSERAITLPLLAQAVTHPSFISLHQQYYPHEVSPAHNGMLATLGNHLMGLFAAEWLAATYPHLPTLALKAAVSAYVGPKTASQVAEGWGAVPLVRWRRMVSSGYTFPSQHTY